MSEEFAMSHDEPEIGSTLYAPIGLPLIRNSSPTLLANQLQGVKPISYDDLTTGEKACWDKMAEESKYREANTVESPSKIAPYASHPRSGSINTIKGRELYIDWKWLRNQVARDKVNDWIVPKGKYNSDYHTLVSNCLDEDNRFSAFLKEYQEGDEIWLYENNGFSCLAGRAGWVIIRENAVVDMYQTCLN